MKLKFFIITFLLCINNSWGGKEKLQVEFIDHASRESESTHLYLSDGRVGILKEKNNTPIQEGDWVEIEMNKKHTITSLKIIYTPESPQEGLNQNEIIQYTPTVLSNMTTANNIFQKMRRDYQNKSQCYNRAHIWSYEEYNRSGLMSEKVFIFFTRRYIRRYNFYWWFHAIPVVLVQHDGSIVRRSMDRRYTRGPLPMKTWSDVFIRSKRTCPVITKYSTYRNNQETEDCYLHFSSMFFWQPRDLLRYENTGYAKKSFIKSEVNWAYYEAF